MTSSQTEKLGMFLPFFKKMACVCLRNCLKSYLTACFLGTKIFLIKVLKLEFSNNPAGIHLFKVINKNARTMCEICSKLTRNTPVVLLYLLLTLNRF